MAARDVLIRPRGGWSLPDIAGLWRFRELVTFLVWRDIKVRYRQTALGVLWAILQPLLTMVALSIFFGGLGKLPSDGFPYPLFAFAGLLPWQLFAGAVTESSGSLVANQNLLTKVYFPRLVIPVAAAITGLVDFAMAFLVLLVLMVVYGAPLTTSVVLLPFFLAFDVVAALAIGLWLSALNVQYRDVRYTLPFLVQLWLIATPVAYSSSLVPERWRPLFAINPMATVIDGFRWALLGSNPPAPAMVVASAVVTLVLLATGALYFSRMEAQFADIV